MSQFCRCYIVDRLTFLSVISRGFAACQISVDKKYIFLCFVFFVLARLVGLDLQVVARFSKNNIIWTPGCKSRSVLSLIAETR